MVEGPEPGAADDGEGLRWTQQEMPVDPEDVAAGKVVRLHRAAPERVVRSRKPAHPEIISVEDFTRAQLLRRA